MSPHRQPRPERTAFSLAGGHARIRASSCSWQKGRENDWGGALGEPSDPVWNHPESEGEATRKQAHYETPGAYLRRGRRAGAGRGRKPSLGGGRRGDRKDLEGEEPALPWPSELLAPPPPLPQAFSLLAACPLRSDQADLRGRRFQRTVSLRRKKFPPHRDVRGVAR